MVSVNKVIKATQSPDTLDHFRRDGPEVRLAVVRLQTLEKIAPHIARVVTVVAVAGLSVSFRVPVGCSLGELAGPRVAKALCPGVEAVAQGDASATAPPSGPSARK